MRHDAFPSGITRQQLVDWYRANRARTRQLFDLIQPDAYYERPIALRNPIVFYEGHLPAFAVNTLVKRALNANGIDSQLEVLFERGIDPEDEGAIRDSTNSWPDRPRVQAYGLAADALVEETLLQAPLEDDDIPTLRGGEAVLTILEHELMHQETLLYMLHNLPHPQKRITPPLNARTPPQPSGWNGEEMIDIDAGTVTLGRARDSAFGWDNEFGELRVDVPEFSIGRWNVTNGEFREFVSAGGYTRSDLWSPEAWSWISKSELRHPHFWVKEDDAYFWRGMFEMIPLPERWPAWVTYAEAEAYARWRGARLLTEAEYQLAAYGTPEGSVRPQPWGSAVPGPEHGRFDFAGWDPCDVGTHPAGASAWGVEDLIGNGWEWTSTLFGPLPGFTPMPSYPEYSADFFDEAHYVLKGASPITPVELIRPSFRNWFRPHYPYVFASFRIAR